MGQGTLFRARRASTSQVLSERCYQQGSHCFCAHARKVTGALHRTSRLSARSGLQQQVAVSDQAWSLEEFKVFEAHHFKPPSNPETLLDVVCERFEELNHLLLHDDFNERDLFRRPRGYQLPESSLQSWLAARLRDGWRGQAFEVTREPEVDQGKRPDLRINRTWDIAGERVSFLPLVEALNEEAKRQPNVEGGGLYVRVIGLDFVAPEIP